MEAMIQMEFALLDWIQSALTSPLANELMGFFTMIGEYGALWLLISGILLCQPKHRRQGAAILAVLAICLLVGNITLKPWVERPRPFHIRTDFPLLIAPPGEYSFPSGHSMSSFGAAGVIYAFYKTWGIAAFVAAGFIAFSRLYFYVHFPTDVLAGALLGLLAAWLVVFVGRRYGWLPAQERKL